MKTKFTAFTLALSLIALLVIVTSVLAAAPTVNNQTLEIDENSANGTSPTPDTISATDPEGLGLTFSVTGGSGQSVFSVASGSGLVTVANTSQLDFETTEFFTLEVEVEDSELLTDTATITIDLIDLNDETPLMSNQAFDVDENSPNGTLVGTMSASDADDEDTLTFTETGGTGAAAFNIESDGDIKVANVSLVDHEANDSLTLNVQVEDENNHTATATATITINDVNERPTVDDFEVDTNEDENYSFNKTIFEDNFTDPEGVDLVFVRIGRLVPAGEGVLKLNGIAVTLLQDIPAADLGQLVYVPPAGWSGTTDFKWNASDGNDTALTRAFTTINVNAVNHPPTVLNFTVNGTEDKPYEFVAAQFENKFNDSDDDSLTRVKITQLPPKPRGTLKLSAADVSLNQEILVANLGNLKFVPADNWDGTATFKWNGKDGTVYADASATVTVNIADENALPTVSDIAVKTDEDVPYTFSKADFESQFNDSDGDDLTRVKIVTLPANGLLKLNGTAVVALQEIDVTDLGTLKFFPDDNWNGTTTFRWNGEDGVDYAQNRADVTIEVETINDPPTVSDINKAADENLPIQFFKTDFASAFDDIDGDKLDEVLIVKVGSNGTLKLSGVPQGDGAIIDAADLGDLTFVPDTDWYGDTTITWNGSDGQTYAAADAEINIKINNDNDLPVLDLNGPASGVNFQATFNTNVGSVKITSNLLTLVDADDLDGTLKIKSTIIKFKNPPPDGTAEVLDAKVGGTSITKDYKPANGTLTLSGLDTVTNYQKVLRTITYENTSLTPDTTQRQVEFRVNDGIGFSNAPIAKIDLVNPGISVTVTPDLQTVISGNTAVFEVDIANIGDVELTNVMLSSAAVADCDKGKVVNKLAAGDSLPTITCKTFNVTERIDNEIIVSATDTSGGPKVTDSDTAVVRVSNPNIQIDVLPVEGTVLEGEDATFEVTVVNPLSTGLISVSVTAETTPILVGDEPSNGDETAAGTPVPACDFGPVSLAGGTNDSFTYFCTVSKVAEAFTIEFNVTGEREDNGKMVDDFDRQDIEMLALTADLGADPFFITANEPVLVQFTVSLANEGSKTVALESLDSEDENGKSLHGDLLDPDNGSVQNNTCPTADWEIVAGGGTFNCSYEVIITADPPSLTHVVKVLAVDVDLNGVQAEAQAVITVSDQQPVTLSLAADPTSLIAPGGTVILAVQVTNNQASEVELTRLVDNDLGGLNGQGDCTIPQTITADDSYSCSYQVEVKDQAVGDSVLFSVTAEVSGESLAAEVTVPITLRGQKVIWMPIAVQGAVAGEPNNGACSAMSLTTNTDYYFLPDDLDDWYRFSLTETSTIHASLSNYVATGQLIVLDGSDCTTPQTLKNDGTQQSHQFVDLKNLGPGTYFIRVYSPENNSSTQPYKLRVDVTSP